MYRDKSGRCRISVLGSHDVAFMACSSPVPEDYGIPKLMATSFLIGLDEESFMDEVKQILGI